MNWPTRSPASAAKVQVALAMVGESRPRMEGYTKEQRAELEHEARAMVKQGDKRS